MESILSQYGLAGLVITILATVVVYQNKKIEFLYKEKNDLQEQRRVDVLEARDMYNNVLSEFSKTNNLLLAKLEGKS